MSYPFFIAKRFLLSSRRSGFVSFITFIAISGVAIGTAALIIGLSILGGFEREIKEKVVGFTAHVQVQGFQNEPLPDYRRVVERIDSDVPGISGVCPYVAREAILKAGSEVDGIFLKGLPEDKDVGGTRNHIVEGRYSLTREEGQLPPLIIGRKLARKLNARLGQTVTAFSVIGPSGGALQSVTYRAAQFELVGLYETGMAEYDDVYAYTDLQSAQDLFQMGEGVTGFDVLVRDVSQAATIADRIEELLGYPFYAKTMFEMYRNLFAWIELQKKPIPIVLGLMIIVATVNIIGTLLMLVMDKTREIGVLKSMGATTGGITRIFFVQGLFIAVVGTALGNVLGFGLSWLQLQYKFFSLPSEIYFMNTVPIFLQSTIPISIDFSVFLPFELLEGLQIGMEVPSWIFVSVIAIILSLLATVLPSRLAGRLDPLVTIRFR